MINMIPYVQILKNAENHKTTFVAYIDQYIEIIDHISITNYTYECIYRPEKCFEKN